MAKRVDIESPDSPDYFRTAEAARMTGVQRIEKLPSRRIELPDGSRVLVLDNPLSVGPDTLTIREYGCGDERAGCVEILAAKRGEYDEATVHCSLGLYEGGLSEFDLCRFNAVFDFGEGTRVSHDDRVDQFYRSVLEGVPVKAERARRITDRDWQAAIFLGG